MNFQFCITLKYRRSRSDMIEVFKITHNIYDTTISPDLSFNESANTRGNNYKLHNHSFHIYDLRKHFNSAPQCSHCKRCTSYSNSVRLSVHPSVRLSATRWYCVKTTACSTVQFILSDSKMCLVL